MPIKNEYKRKYEQLTFEFYLLKDEYKEVKQSNFRLSQKLKTITQTHKASKRINDTARSGIKAQVPTVPTEQNSVTIGTQTDHPSISKQLPNLPKCNIKKTIRFSEKPSKSKKMKKSKINQKHSQINIKRPNLDMDVIHDVVSLHKPHFKRAKSFKSQKKVLMMARGLSADVVHSPLIVISKAAGSPLPASITDTKYHTAIDTQLVSI